MPMDSSRDGWIDRSIEGFIEGEVEGEVSGRVDGQIDGPIDGHLDCEEAAGASGPAITHFPIASGRLHIYHHMPACDFTLHDDGTEPPWTPAPGPYRLRA